MQESGMTETNQRKKESDNSVIKCGKARKSNMFARVKDVRKELHSNQILIILFCKETLLTDQLASSLPSIATNLL